MYHVVTAEMMGYTGSSRDILKRIHKEHLLGRGGCKGLKGLRGGHWMVLFALSDLPQRTRDVLATELSIGMLDLILRVAEQLAIVAGLAFSPQTRLNQVRARLVASGTTSGQTYMAYCYVTSEYGCNTRQV